MSDPTRPTMPLKVMAKLFNLDERRIQQLAKEGVVIKIDHGIYDLWLSVGNYIKYLQERQGKSSAIFDKEKERLLRARADIAEMDRDSRKGQLLESKLVQKVLIEIHSSFKAKILALPNKTAPKVEGVSRLVDIQKIITDEVHECLKEIASHDPSEIIARIVEEYVSAHHPNDGAAADLDGESMG